MKILPRSDSETTSFDRLHPEVQKWIWRRGWESLRDIQDETISVFLDGKSDIIVSAGTASGKTEAVFLPIISEMARTKKEGLSALYVSPLKSLINDQFVRLEELCEHMEIGVVRWHGDAPQAAKRSLEKNPSGIALITPESVEALLVRRPERAKALFAGLGCVVVDELHAFLGDVRGLHLRSLLKRVSAIAGSRPRMIGLSATVGDIDAAKAWLNPQEPSSVRVVKSDASPEIMLKVKAFLDADDVQDPDALESATSRIALDDISDDIFKRCAGSNNLVFAGSRRRVEALTDRLRNRCEKAGIRNEFFAHHGSLSKELREPLEQRLKEGKLPTTAVATTTLELGIDIGTVSSVAQVGAPRSMSSFRQRIGRSGRRGDPAVMRVYVRERAVAALDDATERLRLNVVASVAAVDLLATGFVENPKIPEGAVSAAIQQILSYVCQMGGAGLASIYETVCGLGGPLQLPQKEFIALVRHMSTEYAMIEQSPDGTVMLGREGERIVAARDFYALFETPDEWTLVAEGKKMGTMPAANVLKEGAYLAFAGTRWQIVGVHPEGRIVEVASAKAGSVPAFESLGREGIADELSAAMFSVLSRNDEHQFLDSTAKRLLEEARMVFRANDLDTVRFMDAGGVVNVMTWKGTETNTMVALALSGLGRQTFVTDVGVGVEGVSPEKMLEDFKVLATNPPTLDEISWCVEEIRTAKYDAYAPESLLRRTWALARRERYPVFLETIRSLAVASN